MNERTPIESVIADGSCYDESWSRTVLSDFEDVNHLAGTLARLGATQCVVLVNEGLPVSDVESLQAGIDTVKRSSGPAAISCIPGELAYCKDSSGREVLLSKRTHAKDSAIRQPFRTIVGVLGVAMSLVGLLGLMYPLASEEPLLQMIIKGVVFIGIGGLMMKSAWSGRDEIGRLVNRNKDID